MGILLDKPVSGSSKSIIVPLESYLYLKDNYHYQNSGKHFSEETIEHMTKRFNNNRYHTMGLNQFMDGDFDMTVDQIKSLLDSKNLQYEDGEEIEFISI